MRAEMVGRRVVIRGRVQGVGFRYNLADVAQGQQVTGWCANRPDGAVEAALYGPREQVERVVAWCRHGPPLARVEEIQVTSIPAEPMPDEFSISH